MDVELHGDRHDQWNNQYDRRKNVENRPQHQQEQQQRRHTQPVGQPVGHRELDDLGQVILARRGDSLIRLHDVAELKMHHFELSGRSYSDGQPVLTLAVRREAGSNVIDIKNEMLERVERLNAEVLEPAGMVLRLVADDVGYVQASLVNSGSISS